MSSIRDKDMLDRLVCDVQYITTHHIYFFFFNDTATTEIYTLSLHDALPIWNAQAEQGTATGGDVADGRAHDAGGTELAHRAVGVVAVGEAGEIGRAHV